MESEEYYKKQLGTKLNRDKLKLWEVPYTKEDGSAGSVPEETISKYAEELNLSNELVAALMEGLRVHALDKLAEKHKFQTSGLATLKIKVSGNIGKQKHQIQVEIGLSSKGLNLKSMVAEKLRQPCSQLKLICSGKVIIDDLPLSEQQIKNGSQILALHLCFSESEAREEEKLLASLHDTRHAAELLSSRVEQENDEIDIQIADQTGKPIQLPSDEKKALTLAMALHEKGRQYLKKKHFTLALPLLLEADKEFRLCRSSILNSVDNYAILCLDIVWCYLCLKHIDELPDAEERLRTSETFFQTSYGSDLVRLMSVKGSTGEEQALFVRLHLLQGIVAFHQQKLDIARQIFAKAELELKRLEIDGEKLATVMSMGFNEQEARLGLRACNGNVQNAVSHIMKRREEKKENAKKRKEERRKGRLIKYLGKTGDGQNVKIESYDILVAMGYPNGAAAEALRQANNDINMALEVLQMHPEFLELPNPEPQPQFNVTDAMLAQVVVMGFETEMCRHALVKHSGDVIKAIQDLVNSGGFIQQTDYASPGTSSGSSNATPQDNSSIKSAAQLKEEKEAIDRLISDLPEDEEDYLDITLDEETVLLQEYKSLMQSLQKQ